MSVLNDIVDKLLVTTSNLINISIGHHANLS